MAGPMAGTTRELALALACNSRKRQQQAQLAAQKSRVPRSMLTALPNLHSNSSSSEASIFNKRDAEPTICTVVLEVAVATVLPSALLLFPALQGHMSTRLDVASGVVVVSSSVSSLTVDVR